MEKIRTMPTGVKIGEKNHQMSVKIISQNKIYRYLKLLENI